MLGVKGFLLCVLAAFSVGEGGLGRDWVTVRVLLQLLIFFPQLYISITHRPHSYPSFVFQIWFAPYLFLRFDMSQHLNFLSWNVKGLNHPVKRFSRILNILKLT